MWGEGVERTEPFPWRLCGTRSANFHPSSPLQRGVHVCTFAGRACLVGEKNGYGLHMLVCVYIEWARERVESWMAFTYTNVHMSNVYIYVWIRRLTTVRLAQSAEYNLSIQSSLRSISSAAATTDDNDDYGVDVIVLFVRGLGIFQLCNFTVASKISGQNENIGLHRIKKNV